MLDIARFSEEMKTLREFIESEKVKQTVSERSSAELEDESEEMSMGL